MTGAESSCHGPPFTSDLPGWYRPPACGCGIELRIVSTTWEPLDVLLAKLNMIPTTASSPEGVCIRGKHSRHQARYTQSENHALRTVSSETELCSINMTFTFDIADTYGVNNVQLCHGALPVNSMLCWNVKMHLQRQGHKTNKTRVIRAQGTVACSEFFSLVSSFGRIMDMIIYFKHTFYVAACALKK